MNKQRLRYFLAFLLLFLGFRVILLSSDFLTATILIILSISVLSNNNEND